MKPMSYLLFSLSILQWSCGNDPHDHNAGGKHIHVAPHGGQLLEVGKHGSGFNLELVLHPEGFLQIFILDAHAEDFVRISSSSIDIDILQEDGSSRVLVCKPIEDSATGETVGNTSLFASDEDVTPILPFRGVIRKLQLMDLSFEKITFEFSGKDKRDDHEY